MTTNQHNPVQTAPPLESDNRIPQFNTSQALILYGSTLIAYVCSIWQQTQ